MPTASKRKLDGRHGFGLHDGVAIGLPAFFERLHEHGGERQHDE